MRAIAYDHAARRVFENPIFDAHPLPIDFPQCFQYDRVKELVRLILSFGPAYISTFLSTIDIFNNIFLLPLQELWEVKLKEQ